MADGTAQQQPLAKRRRGPGRPFKKGESGNPAGRPKGARNRLGEAILHRATEHFEKHGGDAINLAFEADPLGYCNMLIKLLPKHFGVDEEQARGAFYDVFVLAGKLSASRGLQE
jgi:hypothetical protein